MKTGRNTDDIKGQRMPMGQLLMKRMVFLAAIMTVAFGTVAFSAYSYACVNGIIDRSGPYN